VDRRRRGDLHKRVRKQKTDRQDAQLILRLLLEDRFPQIWVPSWEDRDLRQLLWHRHCMVQARTRIMNQLQAVALNERLRCKKRLWGEHGGSNSRHSAWPLGPACDGAIANCDLFLHRTIVKTRRQFCPGFFSHPQGESLRDYD
jgi:transposase